MDTTGITWKWLSSIVIGILLAIIGYMWAGMESRVNATEKQGVAILADNIAIKTMLDSEFREVNRRLDRIERKLDQPNGVSSNHGFPTTSKK